MIPKKNKLDIRVIGKIIYFFNSSIKLPTNKTEFRESNHYVCVFHFNNFLLMLILSLA